ncbi:TRUD domain-containing protein [Aphelenchoides fujianensis]|nr:TRUD domain-containing protein [Aphelenchoides fujianensis]
MPHARRKIVIPEVHERSDVAYLSVHPREPSVFAATGDNRLAICRLADGSFDRPEAPQFSLDRSGLAAPIRCLDFDCNAPRLYCASQQCFYAMDTEKLHAADEFDFDAQISCILALDRAGPKAAFNCVIGDDDGKITLLDMRTNTPALVHQSERVAGEAAGIVRMIEGGDHEVFAVLENGVVTGFDLRRREFNDIVVLDKYPTSVCMDGRKNPIVSTDVGDILWIKTSDERVVFKAKHPSECIEKLIPLGDEHILAQFYASDTLLLISNRTHKPLATLTVAMIRPDIGITAFLSDDADRKPWSCIFKHFHSDFLVQEIQPDGTRCAFGSTEAAEPNGRPKTAAAEVDFDLIESPAKLDAESRRKIVEFRRAGGDPVSVDVSAWSKDERRELHTFVRALGAIDSTTKGDQIEVHKPINERKRRRPEEASKKFVHFTLTKEAHDTNFAVNLIAKFLSRNPATFGICGTKDRRALTSQRVSVSHVEPYLLFRLNKRLRGIVISDAELADQRLGLGQLWGNRFSVALREFAEVNDEELKTRLTNWSTNGYINFFGDQRFGSWGSTTAEVGRLILRAEWEAAVNLILRPATESSGQMADVLAKYQETKDAALAFSRLSAGLKTTSIEGTVLKGLSTSPTNFKGALMAIARSTRSLYVHAYQSLVFNKIASRRAQTFGLRTLDGDLYATADGREVGEPTGRIEDVVLPLPFFPLELPKNECGEWYAELLAADGVRLEAFAELKTEFALGPSFRRFVQRPRNVEWELLHYATPNTVLQTFPPFAQRDADGVRVEAAEAPPADWRRALIVRFDLEAGCYATMALRELLRFDLGKENQKEMSARSIGAANPAESNGAEAGDARVDGEAPPDAPAPTEPTEIAAKVPRLDEAAEQSGLVAQL